MPLAPPTTPTPSPSPRRRTHPLVLPLVLVLSIALVAFLIVLLVRPPDPPGSDPNASADSTARDDPPDDLTVRALIPRQPPLPPRATDIVLTANLFHAEPGSPLPEPYPADSGDPGDSDDKDKTNATRGLSPTGQAAMHCTAVAEQAIRTICTGTALTAQGQITFAGAMIENDALAEPPSADYTFTITGGTGSYQAASGNLSITAYSPTQQDWRFDFTPAPDEAAGD